MTTQLYLQNLLLSLYRIIFQQPMAIRQIKELCESLPLSMLLKNIQLSTLILSSHATAFQYIQKKKMLIFLQVLVSKCGTHIHSLLHNMLHSYCRNMHKNLQKIKIPIINVT